ncbi:hypothetical protein [Neisseria cinerea]|uniref:hypothetical protein n=1 Tax=Neisseria cinerea TaxID=483 RepID=UPI0027E0100A|nr:hypothetical protein [Neisseria cinerea]
MEKFGVNILYHGTNLKFKKWKVGHQAHNKGYKAHSALFFTTDKEYAKDSGENKYLASFKYKKEACKKILDLRNCSDDIYEKFRNHVIEKYPMIYEYFGLINDPLQWKQLWQEGKTFKLFPTSDQIKYHHANFQSTNNRCSWIFLQGKTRELIEYWILAARDLGYNILICNEWNSFGLKEPKTSLCIAILDLNIIEDGPDWLN